jgi:membrane protease YdiL (CAAX protease family)
MNRQTNPKLTTGLAIVTALVGPPLFVVVSNRLFGRSPTLAIQIVLQILFCGFAALIVWVVMRRERLSLESIGIRQPTWATLISGIVLWGVNWIWTPLIAQPVLNTFGRHGLEAGLQELVLMPVWFRVFVHLTGGMVEEILYRGYAIERLGILTGHRWMGGVISAVIFGLAHIPTWGVAFALGVDLPFGIVMTIFYLWRRDLIANMIAHSGGGVVAMLTDVP